MNRLVAFVLVMGFAAASAAAGAQALAKAAPPETWYLTVAGLGGEPDYEQEFEQWAAGLDKVFRQSDPGAHVTTLSAAAATRAALLARLSAIASGAHPDDVIVVTLLGHGSFDGVEYKFNLPGPDLSAADLASALNQIPARRQLVVVATSCSGGAIPALQHPGRAVITATKSGTEKNATVFARYWLEALQDPTTDTDKNETISALEAFQYADRKTALYYSAQQRLATEHPTFEDVGKGPGVRAPALDSGEGMVLAALTLVRMGSVQAAYADPKKRDLLAKKEDLERQIGALRYQKAAIPEDEYQSQMKQLLIDLALTQKALDQP